jgi:hypothetical protein
MTRYDSDKDETRHAAATKEDCEDMGSKYGWPLKAMEITDTPILPVDCIFEGNCPFPKPWNETDND